MHKQQPEHGMLYETYAEDSHPQWFIWVKAKETRLNAKSL